MKRLLIPTDFSPCSNNAINLAVGIAKALPVEITLLHVYEHPGSAYTEHAGLDKEFKTTMMHESLEKLTQVKTSIMETESVTVSVLQAEGKIKKSIPQVAEEAKADMIVMGTLGSGGIKERLWGSTTAAVIGATKIPVIAVPLEYNGYVPSEILLVTNQFETSGEILNPLFELAAMLLARVHLAVFTPEKKEDTAVALGHAHKLKEYQQKVQDLYQDKKLVPVHLSGNNFEDSVEEYIDKNNIEMLAMITYHRSLFERLFHPSRTKKMSYRTRVPLLAIPVENDFLNVPYSLMTLASG